VSKVGAALESIAGKAGSVASVVGGILSIKKLGDDFKMFFNPGSPALGSVGTTREDSLGTVWIKVDEKTWVTEAYLL
jgi:hypothetical protein